MEQDNDSWSAPWRGNYVLEAHKYDMLEYIKEFCTTEGISKLQLRKKLVLCITIKGDDCAKPGELLWKDLLEEHIYDALERNGLYVIGYITYREHRNGEYSIMDCKNRSTMFDVSEYLTETFNKFWK